MCTFDTPMFKICGIIEIKFSGFFFIAYSLMDFHFIFWISPHFVSLKIESWVLRATKIYLWIVLRFLSHDRSIFPDSLLREISITSRVFYKRDYSHLWLYHQLWHYAHRASTCSGKLCQICQIQSKSPYRKYARNGKTSHKGWKQTSSLVCIFLSIPENTKIQIDPIQIGRVRSKTLKTRFARVWARARAYEASVDSNGSEILCT